MNFFIEFFMLMCLDPMRTMLEGIFSGVTTKFLNNRIPELFY